MAGPRGSADVRPETAGSPPRHSKISPPGPAGFPQDLPRTLPSLSHSAPALPQTPLTRHRGPAEAKYAIVSGCINHQPGNLRPRQQVAANSSSSGSGSEANSSSSHQSPYPPSHLATQSPSHPANPPTSLRPSHLPGGGGRGGGKIGCAAAVRISSHSRERRACRLSFSACRRGGRQRWRLRSRS